MPAQGRSAAPSLPPVDDDTTAPFSDLFKSGFDPITIDSTSQLADQSIFVASNGQRYRIERILDPSGPAQGRVPTSAPIPPPSAQQIPYPTPSATFSGSPTSHLRPQLNVYSPDSAHGWGRSASDASSHSHSSGASSARSGHVAALPPQPRAAAPDISGMMAHMSINQINRFGATPLYRESDGGVQAAETLTDPDVPPRGRSAATSPTSPGSWSASPRMPYQPPPPNYHAPGWAPGDYPSPGHISQFWTNVDYPNYTAQTYAHLQRSRQEAVAVTGLPSLVEGATHIAPPLPPSHRASDPVSMLSPLSPDRERWPEVRDSGVQGAAGNGYSYTYPSFSSVHVSSAPPSVAGRQQSMAASYANWPPGDIDTQTPVVVQQHQARSTTGSDGASTGRDNVLPGEDMVFDGPVKSATGPSLTVPLFKDGVLKVFRNTLNHDLRFYCKVDRESETYWMKASNAQLVPAYAYDQRLSNIVYVRDNEGDRASGPVQASQGNCRPSGIYQFSSLRELFDFQARLTGEKVVLDIGSVRMVTLKRANSRSSTQFSSARLQIWHEEGGRSNAQSDVASFVTAGTTLSGPVRNRVVASSSRLMVFLGRSGEYISVFSTSWTGQHKGACLLTR
ncbi:hypothetical protein N658DRAFT_415770 [Parathielavia hyrcaniae]|uniref:Uncharacterized protein n=1 Tax=Parathielavia hyrcaniae TaxID=113614 RepID=A0AAN6QCA2_9PEZI|nr:hypothetical protein N658DRAFT_415770 [Parathielavia hyrcaniae]